MILDFSNILFGCLESRRRRWTGNLTRMREISNSHLILVGKTEGKGYLKKGTYIGIILKQILEK